MLFSSCERDETGVFSKNSISITVDRFVEDVSGSALTKTSMDPANNFVITWADGDTIGIFPREGFQEPFKIPANQVGSATAKFDGGYWDIKDGLTYNAYYPFSIGNFMGSDMQTRIPVTYLGQYQNGTECNAGAFDYTYSDWTEASFGNVNFAFHHLGAILVLSLPIPASATYTSLAIVAEDAVIPTTGIYDLTATSPALIPDAQALTKSLGMQLNNFSGVKDEVSVFYMMMPPVNLTGTTVKVVLTAESGTCTYTVDSKNIQAGKLFRLAGTLVDNSVSGTVDPWDEDDPTFSVSPTTLDFGEVVLGQSDTLYFSISNTSNSQIGIENITLSDNDFNLSWYYGTIESGSTQIVGIAFVPTSAGDHSCTMAVKSGNTTVNVNCTATAVAVPTPPASSEPEYVDLGLPSGVKWATFNLGATMPQEYGRFFQWGDTTAYSRNVTDGKSFGWASYLWSNGSSTSLTKYCNDNTYGQVDNLSKLVPEDDAASVSWGDNWRMPTESDWKELKNNCSWTWTNDYNGTHVAGFVVTSMVTGYANKSIFLPAAGYRTQNEVKEVGSSGYYWSSSLMPGIPEFAMAALFGTGNSMLTYSSRCYGQSIRPVCGTPAVRSFTVSPTLLDFGEVKVGESDTLYFSIKNTGNSQISIETISISDKDFNLSWHSGTIESGSTQIVGIAFVPTTAGNHSGSFKVKSGDISVDVTITASAVVVVPVVPEEPVVADYVDLGLPSGTKWASYNLGATRIQDAGHYFQWGDVVGYGSDVSDGKVFNYTTYKWCNGSNTLLTKYCTDVAYGTVDNKTSLVSDDDAAKAIWKGDWQMPSAEDWAELQQYCTCTWVDNFMGTGVAGCMVASNVDGHKDKYIFLPAAGGRANDMVREAGNYGLYWSSTLSSTSAYLASSFCFCSQAVAMLDSDRSSGLTIRPVLK